VPELFTVDQEQIVRTCVTTALAVVNAD
jgi:hypothetical protein